mgnify:CR=1 FL=1
MKIIDAHTHFTDDGTWFGTRVTSSSDKLIPNVINSPLYKAVILPFAPFTTNSSVARVCEAHPDKFIGFASVHPEQDESPSKKLEEDIKRYHLKGLKLHARLQGFDFHSPAITDIFRKAAELSLPVIIDAWIKKEDNFYQDLLDVICDIARKVPEVNIIIPHLGGEVFTEMPGINEKHPNVFFDISHIFMRIDKKTLTDEVIPILTKLDTYKIIYGSDFPEINLNRYLKLTENILEEAGFSEEIKENIFYTNITDLINIKDKHEPGG